jgi:hypothetical protein
VKRIVHDLEAAAQVFVQVEIPARIAMPIGHSEHLDTIDVDLDLGLPMSERKPGLVASHMIFPSSPLLTRFPTFNG